MAARPSRREVLGLLAILALAAVTRLPGLDVRGPCDADQGNDMLVVAGILRDGEIPLLGPPTLDRHVPPRRRVLLPARPRGPRAREPIRSSSRDGSRCSGSGRSRRRGGSPVARRAARGGRRRPARGRVARRDRRVDVHLEPEPHPGRLRPRVRGGAARVAGWIGTLVAPGGSRRDGDDAVSRAGDRGGPAARRRVRRGPFADGGGPASRSPRCSGQAAGRSRSSSPATSRCSSTSSRATSPRRGRSSSTSLAAVAPPAQARSNASCWWACARSRGRSPA